MPEGDTILRTARTLSHVALGKSILRFESPLPAFRDCELEGKTITSIDAHGKNLFIRFDDGRVLHSHMRMTGAWHVYRPNEPWQKPRTYARIVMQVEGFVLVCFSAPVVRLITERGEIREFHRLGPDILKEPFDAREVQRRLRQAPERAIGVAVMDQSCIAGIGNIYKSESLFMCRMNPFASVSSLSEDEIDSLLARARQLMLASTAPGVGPRVTRERYVPSGRERYWVYGRSGAPCFACKTKIQTAKQGETVRTTYYCSRCQHTS